MADITLTLDVILYQSRRAYSRFFAAFPELCYAVTCQRMSCTVAQRSVLLLVQSIVSTYIMFHGPPMMVGVSLMPRRRGPAQRWQQEQQQKRFSSFCPCISVAHATTPQENTQSHNHDANSFGDDITC